MSDLNVLTPGQQIRPKMDESIAISLVRELYGFQVTKINELNAYDDKNYHVFVDNHHTNPHVKDVSSHGYVLKILNSLDSRNVGFVEGQNEMMIYLNQHGITCSVPVRNLRGSFYAVEKLQSSTNVEHVIRLLVYQPGSTLYVVPLTSDLLKDVGYFAARLDATLVGFSHPAYENRSTLWMLSAVPKLRDFVYAVKNPEDRKMILVIVERFERQVLTVTDRLEQGIIHGDLNEQNLLVNFEGNRVSAVIDFGDTHRACMVYEIAITVCYMIIQARDVTAAKHVIDGYQSVKKLTELEKEIFKTCVCARLCQSLALGAYSQANDPQNDYVLVTQKNGWSVLRTLWPMDDKEVMKVWGLED